MLKLESDRAEEVNIQTFGSDKARTQTVEVVKAAISLKEGGTTNVLFSTVPLICEPLSCQPIAYTKQKYLHLAELELADSSRVGEELQIDALIGSDHYWQLATGKVIQGQSGPTAIHTRLGWVLSGPVWSAAELNSLNSQVSHTLHIQATNATPSFDNLVKQFWDLESLGITQNEPSVHDVFKKSTQFTNNRHEVSLPWRPNQPQLLTNIDLAKKRLQGLLKKLRKHPEVHQECHAIIQEQLRLGIIEKCSEQSSQNSDGVIHYLPHHAVIRTDKQTAKLRIVYDASARGANGLSLNDCLFSGPKFDQQILDILLRFRTYKIALIADIEKAFLMVSVRKKDRNALRFLWVDDTKKSSPTVEMRFTRVVFGMSASPFLLNATINYHLERYRDKYSSLVDTLLQSMYVDDVTCGATSEDEAFQLYDTSIKLFAEGGFNLRKFVTNSSSLQQRISNVNQKLTHSRPAPCSVMEENTTYTSTLFNNKTPNRQKVLGVSWDPASDMLEFDIRPIAASLQALQLTKRNIISFASRFYDPLGFLSQVIIMLKVFFQELCKIKLDWDDQLPSVLLGKWKDLLYRFQGTVITLPRCYFHSKDKQYSYLLYRFCDASTAAYAAVVYLRTGVDLTCFVASKTRVSPLNQQTIPRLELLSCLLLAKLISHVLGLLSMFG